MKVPYSRFWLFAFGSSPEPSNQTAQAWSGFLSLLCTPLATMAQRASRRRANGEWRRADLLSPATPQQQNLNRREHDEQIKAERYVLDVEQDFGGVLLFLLGNERARADEGHVSFDNVEQLRQFVNASAPQPLSHPGNAIVVMLGRTELLLVGALEHRPELEYCEQLTVFADTLLMEDRRSGGIEANGDPRQEHDGRRQDYGET